MTLQADAGPRKSENHSSEEALQALRKAGISIDSCLMERLESSNGSTNGKAAIADEELVTNTLQQIENLLNRLAAQAPAGPYTARRIEALTGTRLWLPTALAATKQGLSVTDRPEDDPSQRQAWLGPGSGPRFKSPADREAAQRLREATLAAGRVPDSAALHKVLGVPPQPPQHA
jgi:hypothetical protein